MKNNNIKSCKNCGNEIFCKELCRKCYDKQWNDNSYLRQKKKVEKKVYDQYMLEEEIKKFPHTYKTILTNNHCNNGTLQTILRRKLNILHKEGYVYKVIIPGTRFGEVIFYHPNKEYKLLIEGDRSGVNIYCFFVFKKVRKYYIIITEYWELEECSWIKKNKEQTIFLGDCLKMV